MNFGTGNLTTTFSYDSLGYLSSKTMGDWEQSFNFDTDHLGSIIALYKNDGTVAEQYTYDAWGKRRNPDDWSYDSVPKPTLLARGYTGHEHLDEFSLINMNGRV